MGANPFLLEKTPFQKGLGVQWSKHGVKKVVETARKLLCIASPVEVFYFAAPCKDAIDNCAQYGTKLCSDVKFYNWVNENCKAHCNRCRKYLLSWSWMLLKLKLCFQGDNYLKIGWPPFWKWVCSKRKGLLPKFFPFLFRVDPFLEGHCYAWKQTGSHKSLMRELAPYTPFRAVSKCAGLHSNVQITRERLQSLCTFVHSPGVTKCLNVNGYTSQIEQNRV